MNDPSGMHPMFCNGMGGWMILWWVPIILIGVAVLSFFSRRNNSYKEKSALDILKERYARGEISKQEFEEKKQDIL